MAYSAAQMSRPLVVSRAGVVEKTMMLGSAFIGLVGIVLPWPISGALEAAFGEPWSSLYFGFTLVLPGLSGWWSVRRSRRLRTTDEIKEECSHERLALSGLAAAWAAYAMFALAGGWTYFVAGCLAGFLALGLLLRIRQMRHDLRKLDEAIASGPNPADPSPMAEG